MTFIVKLYDFCKNRLESAISTRTLMAERKLEIGVFIKSNIKTQSCIEFGIGVHVLRKP